MEMEDLRKEFVNAFGESDEKIHAYFSPGRVHTDYNGGFVFPCALSFGTYLLVRKNNEKSVHFKSLNQEYTARIELDSLNKPHDSEWVNYPLGVFDQYIKKGIDISQGMELLYWGDVPNGAGLSSSASIEVVTAYAINDQLNAEIDMKELIKMSQKAENEFVGVNCGIMDQFASGMGKKDHAIFLNCDTLDYEHVPLALDGIKVIISNTNSPHKLNAGQYNQRVAECKIAVEHINKAKKIGLLGELSEAEFQKVESNIENPVAKKRARHVVSEIQRTVDAVKALKAGDVSRFGNMMNASHISLRDDYEVTGPELDAMAEAAWELDGVIGSRMTGAGFGGCTVSLVKEDCVEDFIKMVGEKYKQKTGLSAEFYVADVGDGTKKIGKI